MSLDFLQYKEYLKKLEIGKQLPTAIYIHESTLDTLPKELAKHFAQIVISFELDDEDWNIIKFFKRDYKISLLHYPDFDDYAYPSLHQSYTIDIDKNKYTKANYSKSNNPPILHRKETFVKPTYSNFKIFMDITNEGKAIELYKNTKRIGFKKNWERLIKSKGFYLDSAGRLHALADKPTPSTSNKIFSGEVERHKTAIDRDHLSQPLKALAKHGYLNGEYSMLDYGCGKGDDVRELEAHGINVTGWDPTHRPDSQLLNSDIVNLGFVLNVIEDRQERDETLLKAYSHTNKLLIVSVMIAGENKIEQFTPYKDGVITSRNTFQKYYSQGEFRYYIESTLETNAIPVRQGIFILFKDKIEEQHFLINRQHIKRDWAQLTQREIKAKIPTLKKSTIEKHIELFTDYWNTTLELGRIPANDEFEFSDEIRRIVGSHNKTHNALLEFFGTETFESAISKRKDDLIVYFALSLFDKRTPTIKMPESLRRDIKVFFSSITKALEQSRELLFSLGNPEIINNACIEAYSKLKCGSLVDSHSYTFHKSFLGELPPTLRIYIGCATQLVGDIDEFHLIKAHIRSGKVSLMRYDDWEKDQPLLIERIKIKLRELDIDFFDYVDIFTPTPLDRKSAYRSI